MPIAARASRAWWGCAAATVAALALLSTRTRSQQPLPAGFDLSRLSRLDAVVNVAIAAHHLPGAVVVVGRGTTVMWRKAYGHRALVPSVEPMTVDTVFDLASLTKVVATTTVVMQLIEDGKLRLTDPVATYIPEFARYGKSRVTIRDLLTHTSGLRPDLDQGVPWTGIDGAIRAADDETLVTPPGEKFAYSDIGFILLGEVASRITKEPLDELVRERVLAPLGMADTTFNPPASMMARVAPTEICRVDPGPCAGVAPSGARAVPGEPIRGVVHDPTARRMGGVAGHAGLFSTADDLTRFCEMLLGGGALGSARVLSPLAVARMTSPATSSSEPNVRGLGWDLDSSYSANRGEFLPMGSFGHTGFTGTSIWMDPATGMFVIFLSNRVHPDGTGDVTPLRAEVASIAATSLTDLPPGRAWPLRWSEQAFPARATAAPAVDPQPVRTGLDMLRASGFKVLQGLRVGLLTNQTGRARDGASTIDLLSKAPGVTLVSLFSPEHGIRGLLDAAVPETRDETTGLPIHSLYGTIERPTADMLAGLDAVVIDLQDAGARFYTYATTTAYVMEAAAAKHVKVFVLDRPNPIGGVEIEGPALDASEVGFTGYLPAMPIRHGLTMGEIARLFNAEKPIHVDLTVVTLMNWHRDEWYDETGLAWVNPSPNLRTLYAALLYPGLGAFEGANLSVGRGTDTPFEQIGAPWIDGRELSATLNARHLDGVRFYPVTFTPASSTFAGDSCQGVFIEVLDRNAVRPVRLGVEVAAALVKLFPGKFEVARAVKLFGSAEALSRLAAGDDPSTIAASWAAADARWRALRAKYLLY